MRWLVALAAAALLAPGPRPELLVAAAADLRYALEEVGSVFRQAHRVEVTFSFGSSGQLAYQVQHGAPFDVFFSADELFVQRLAQRGAVLPDSVALYAVGRLVVWVPHQSALPAHLGLQVLLESRVRYVALANPEHAPYGRAARQALVRSGLWEKVQPKVVYADNVALALQLVQSGNAEIGLVALSLALAPPVRTAGRFWLVPQSLHDPLRQAATVVARSRSPRLARTFLAFVNGPTGRTVLRRYGFLLPGEAP